MTATRRHERRISAISQYSEADGEFQRQVALFGFGCGATCGRRGIELCCSEQIAPTNGTGQHVWVPAALCARSVVARHASCSRHAVGARRAPYADVCSATGARDRRQVGAAITRSARPRVARAALCCRADGIEVAVPAYPEVRLSSAGIVKLGRNRLAVERLVLVYGCSMPLPCFPYVEPVQCNCRKRSLRPGDERATQVDGEGPRGASGASRGR